MKALLSHHKTLLRIKSYKINAKSLSSKYSNIHISPIHLEVTNNANSLKYWKTQYCPYNATYRRSIFTSSSCLEKSSSKIEDAVKTLKEAEKEKEKIIEGKSTVVGTSHESIDSSKAQENIINTSSSQHLTEQKMQKTTEVVPIVPVKKTMLQKIWAELVHYYHGFRLLFIDINISRKLLWKVLNGGTLSRREHRLMIRTTSDLFRLVPFSVFIIVPFMELLLPLAIKFFPGMLPSTFQTASEEERKIKQNLKVKIEMAKFLQKTLDEMTVQHKNHRSEAAKEFSEFFQRVRTSGTFASSDEIMKFAKLFEDELTLDALNRQQLLALCRVLEVSTIGTTNILRFQLHMKLRNLAADDRMIQREGIDSLNLAELQHACRSRGMRAYGIPEDKLKIQLADWINLSLNEKVPPSLLLLSRALMLPEDAEVSEKLKATMASLPETIATQTKAVIGEREGKIDNKTKIEILKEEQRRIKEEEEERKEAEAEIKAKEEQQQQAKASEELLQDKAPIIQSDTIVKPDQITVSSQEPKERVLPKIEKELTSEDLKILTDALNEISSEKKLLLAKEEIKEIKEEIAEYEEDVEELNKIVEQKLEKIQLKESRAAKLLLKKVNSMISNLDKALEDLETKEKQIKTLNTEPSKATEAVDAVIAEEAKRTEELVRIDEMMNAIRKIQKVSDESVLEQIEKLLSRIDDDRDGSLKVEDVLKIIETIGKENINLNEKQINEIIDLIDKEEIIETEEMIEKALKKEQEQRNVLKKANEDDFTTSEVNFILQDKATEIQEPSSTEKEEVDEKIVKANNQTVNGVVDSTTTLPKKSVESPQDTKNKSV
ncbi:hypothetical protein PVAND_011427 [Polypedilum vanderplanki]|uniref:Mitochondrial proton/calcium exchanger protein n=1 Tax=Polypedilum vanderplanki TaxID=319348 RepID=A0A9J6CK16_POLVA|nr:hypothetical protein PVAND_011427 [Polypedilum vanderplanki]